MAHALLLTPAGPPPVWDAKLNKRPSLGSLTASSIARGKNDRAQSKGEEEDVGQGIEVVYDRLSAKDKSERTRETEMKQDDSNEKQTSKTIESTMVDIVAIPGLEAHPKHTWIKRRRIANRVGEDVKNFKDGPSCIADPTMLPDVLPNSRIMTFSYASDWRGLGKTAQHQPVSQRVDAVADILLRELRRLRKNCPKRPIIFLAHSMGGMIVEKAVVKSKVKSDHLEIYNSIAGCVFLGAPFKGTESQARAAAMAKAGALVELAEYTPLLELMQKDSHHLADMLTDFLDVVNEATIQIFCFYELQKSDMSKFYKKMPLNSILPAHLELVADEDSSTIQGKEKQGLNRNHFDLNKFESNRDREWIALSSVIDRMATKASKSLKERRNALPDRISSEKYLEILTTLAAMEADPDADVQAIEDERGQAIADSASLIFRNDKIRNWLETVQTGVLWISLYPGMSSAMMAVAFYRRIEEEIRGSQFDDYLCYFFCDSKNVRKNNTWSILKAFIRQMLKTTQRLALHLPFDQQRGQMKKQNVGNAPAWDSFANLRLAFLAMLKDPLVNSITIVIDSLHKIDDDSRVEMLDLIEESLSAFNSSTGQAKVKWICLGLDRTDIKSRMQHALNITAEELGTPAELVRSLKSLVRNRVVALSETLGYSREYTFWLRTEILTRAEGNTTWVDLACGEIESVAPKSINVRSFAERLKQDLTPLYRQIQARVLNPTNEGLEYTKEILRTMMIVFHNPTLNEIAVLAGLPSDTWDNSSSIREYLNRCGSFLKIVQGKRHERVHFMDSTALEYLNQEAADELGHHDRLSIQHGIIALRCLNFLMNSQDEEDVASSIRIGYPKQFWLSHAQKACEELPDLIEDFGLDSDFWGAGNSPWWPKLSSLTALWPSLSNLSVLHLAAYFNFPILLDNLLDEGSIHKDEINCQDTLGRTPLYWAALKGHFDIVQKLVAHGADINPVSTNEEEGLAALYGAAENGHVEILKWLLEHGAVVDAPNNNYGTALCAAANDGHTNIIDILLKAGATKLTPSNWIRGNALGAACYFGHPETAKFLLKAGFDPNVPDADGALPLVHAIKSRDAELIEMLLRRGTSLDGRQAALEAAALSGFEEAIKLILIVPTGLSLRQALLDVARLGYTLALDNFPVHALSQEDLDDALYLGSDMEKKEVVEKLIFMGASANAKGEEFGNALQASAWDGTSDLMRLLVSHGANVNEICGKYGTALQAAAFQGDKNNIEFLLQSGAKVNEGPVGEYGNALYAAVAGNNPEAVRTLVKYGADINAYGGELKFALLQAARTANSEIIRYLIEHGADIKCKADDGTNVILIASYTLPKEDLRYLYEHGANVHIRDQSGNTVLIGCCHYQDLDSVQWLVDVGVEINAVSSDHGSALQAAANNGHEEICEILLKNGADVNQFDENNAPSLLKAAEIDDEETFDILLQYGADISFSSDQWGNAVEAAIRGDAAGILSTILEKTDSDVNGLLRSQGTPLHMASLRESSLSVIELLLSKGANPNVVGGKYHACLQAAAYSGYINLISLFIEQGADKTTRGGFYGTAANAAAAKGMSEITTTLLGNEGGSATDEALHYAIHYHQHEMVETLLDDMNADITSKGKWGNVFQALSTALAESELNSDDETENDEDSDIEGAEQNEDDSEVGENATDIENANDGEDKDEDEDEDDEEEEAEEVELTDEEKVQRIDTALRTAFESISVDPSTLPKDPVKADIKRSKSYAKVVRRQTRAENAAKRELFSEAVNGVDIPPVPPLPLLDYARYPVNGAALYTTATVPSAREGNHVEEVLPAVTNAAQTAQQYQISGSISHTEHHLPHDFLPQLTLRVPTIIQARTISNYESSRKDELSLLRNETVTIIDRSIDRHRWKVQKADGAVGFAPAGLFVMLVSNSARGSGSLQGGVGAIETLHNDAYGNSMSKGDQQGPSHSIQALRRNDTMYDGYSAEQAQFYQEEKSDDERPRRVRSRADLIEAKGQRFGAESKVEEQVVNKGNDPNGISNYERQQPQESELAKSEPNKIPEPSRLQSQTSEYKGSESNESKEYKHDTTPQSNNDIWQRRYSEQSVASSKDRPSDNAAAPVLPPRNGSITQIPTQAQIRPSSVYQPHQSQDYQTNTDYQPQLYQSQSHSSSQYNLNQFQGPPMQYSGYSQQQGQQQQNDQAALLAQEVMNKTKGWLLKKFQ